SQEVRVDVGLDACGLAQLLHIPEAVALRELASGARGEHQWPLVGLGVGEPPIEAWTQLPAEGHGALLGPLSEYREEGVVQVNVLTAAGEGFSDPNPSVEQEERQGVRSAFSHGPRLEMDEGADLGVAQKDLLRERIL